MRKSIIKSAAKRIGLLGFVLAGVICSYGQSSKPSPAWLSKDVQRIANKRNFEAENSTSINIRTKSLSQMWIVSKGVNRGMTDRPEKGNIVSKGIPAWTISKGVQRIGK